MKEELPPEVKNWSEIMDEQERARKRLGAWIKQGAHQYLCLQANLVFQR